MGSSGKKAIRVLTLWLAASFAWPAVPALADVPEFELYNSDSTLSFIAIQNSAPVKGSFKHFDADIRFAPDNLAESSIKVTIDIDSLMMADMEIIDTLKSSDWFSTEKYPQAIYTSDEIRKADTPADYIAVGKLTLKDHTFPVTLYFHMDSMDKELAVASGYATIDRKRFGIGEGKWTEDTSVQSEVRVEFYIEARVKH